MLRSEDEPISIVSINIMLIRNNIPLWAGRSHHREAGIVCDNMKRPALAGVSGRERPETPEKTSTSTLPQAKQAIAT
jgi:hypothetical protein